ncbi:MAG: signal peptidase I [Clostridium sp.]
MKNKSIIGICILIILICKFFILDIYSVNGNSMYPTITNKEYLIISKLNANYNNEDIILLKINNEKYIKRIIGSEGAKIKFNGKLYINDVYIELGSIINEKVLESLDGTILNKDEFFVIGDNISESIDSRFWGIINENNLIGKVIGK